MQHIYINTCDTNSSKQAGLVVGPRRRRLPVKRFVDGPIYLLQLGRCRGLQSRLETFGVGSQSRRRLQHALAFGMVALHYRDQGKNIAKARRANRDTEREREREREREIKQRGRQTTILAQRILDMHGPRNATENRFWFANTAAMSAGGGMIKAEAELALSKTESSFLGTMGLLSGMVSGGLGTSSGPASSAPVLGGPGGGMITSN